MSKRITDLNKAMIGRGRKAPDPDHAGRARPRLAERLVALAPLRQLSAPLAGAGREAGLPSVREDPSLELSSLAGAGRFQRPPEPVPPPRPAAPGTALAVREPPAPALPPPLPPAGAAPATQVPPATDPPSPRGSDLGALAAFAAGLMIATVSGILLYMHLF